MELKTRDRSLGDGVYFKERDYIGLGPRVVIFCVDLLVLVGLQWILDFVWINTVGGYTQSFNILSLAIVWLYVVPLKRSRFRTLGYMLMRCKLVTLTGNRPSLLMLTLRSLLWMLGPFNFVLDLIWCGIDEDRQTLRDRFSNMCLVRNDAEPIGVGEVHSAIFTAFGFTFMYPRVVRPKAVPASSCTGLQLHGPPVERASS